MIKKVILLRSEEMLHGIERETLEKAASTETSWIYFRTGWVESVTKILLHNHIKMANLMMAR